jgi:glycosyltransferase involved in cell wall biosynthesis
MKLSIALEYRFACDADGAVWTQTAFPYSFWRRYLKVFDGVQVLARVRRRDSLAADWQRADGEGVTFAHLPDYQGPLQYSLRAQQLTPTLRKAIDNDHAIILRVPSVLAARVLSHIAGTSRPFGLEVVGDPYEAFSPGAVVHPLRGFFRIWFARQLRSQCATASGVAYVTKESLQRAYPARKSALSMSYSDIEMDDEAFVLHPRQAAESQQRRYRIVSVGSLEQLYKGPDVWVRAAKTCVEKGMDLELVWLGDGKYRPEVLALARSLGLSDRAAFVGQVAGGVAVRNHLDASDLFVLPSRTEGLPRALIEAMARGLPCVASSVGGVPELLDPGDLVRPGDSEGLAQSILSVLSSPRRMAEMSARNLDRAREYHERALEPKRIEFYTHIRDCTALWNRSFRDQQVLPIH